MSGRADVIVTACVIMSAAMCLVSPFLAFSGALDWACYLFVGACYFVMLAMFVTIYGRNDG